MKLIGFTGKTGVGKDYTAGLFRQNFLILSFGDILKEEIIRNGICDFNSLYVKKTGESRELMIKYATEKRELDTDYFVNLMYVRIKIAQFHGYNNFIIPDVRFSNEEDFIRSNGGKIVLIENEEGNRRRKVAEDRLDKTEERPRVSYDFIFDNDFSNDMKWRDNYVKLKCFIHI